MEYVSKVVEFLIQTLTRLGPISGVVLILLESIFPVLPLGVFITLNMQAFGSGLGFILSWLSTCLGCFLSFLFFKRISIKRLDTLLKKKKYKNLSRIIKRFHDMPFSNFVILLALPFTPAFLMNIAAGISKMSDERFMVSLLLGKVPIVFFWGYIGKSLLESITDIKTLMMISILVTIAYLLSKWVEAKYKI